MGTLTGVTRCWALDPSAAFRRLLARDGFEYVHPFGSYAVDEGGYKDPHVDGLLSRGVPGTHDSKALLIETKGTKRFGVPTPRSTPSAAGRST